MSENGDYISREAAIDFIRSYRCSTDVAIHMEQHLNEIPAADVRPVARGTWIWKDDGEVVCSECNDLIAIVGNTEDLATVISGFNFCPSCGADMRPEPPKEEGE